MTGTSDTAGATQGRLDLPSAADLRNIIERKNEEKAAEELKSAQRQKKRKRNTRRRSYWRASSRPTSST